MIFFENAWLRDPRFLPSTLPSWSNVGGGRCAAGCLAARKKWFKAAAKVRKRLHKFIPTFDNDCKFVIDLLDFWEECRPLSLDEKQLREDARAALAASIRRQSAYWKQRGKCRAVCEGDENTGFFHASASSRFRKNCIPVLSVDGVDLFSHESKACALRAYYKDLLGTTSPCTWNFSLSDLYGNSATLPNDLSNPFTSEEIRQAFLDMNRLSSPGPDGFGPSFYRSFWPSIKHAILPLFAQFHQGIADLERLNRAHIVLLPKNTSPSSPEAFRPISLQNCPIKAIANLTSRLKPLIPISVHGNQTGFITGRNIAENYVYAADLVSSCTLANDQPWFLSSTSAKPSTLWLGLPWTGY